MRSPGSPGKLAQLPRPLSGLPVMAAHPLKERHKPLDGADWHFEMKYDGYCGLLYFEQDVPL
jgi:hypothetical protein